MRILFVADGFGRPKLVAPKVLARNVARYMAKNRNDVFVFLLRPSREQEGDILLDGVRIDWVFAPPDRGTRFSDSYLDATVDFQFAKFVAEVKPDAAMVWHTIGLSAGILEVSPPQLTVPYVVFLTDFHYLCHLTHLLTAQKPCDGRLMGPNARIVFLARSPPVYRR